MSEEKYNIFISYRRKGGDVMAKYLHLLLTEWGYTVFYDYEALHSGQFEERILENISKCDDFLVILSKGMFDEYQENDDWVQKEVKHAMKCNKNIVPVQMKGFEFPRGKELEKCPSAVKHLYSLNSVLATDIGRFSIQDLRRFLIGKPSGVSKLYEGRLREISSSVSAIDAISDDVKRETLKAMLYSLVKENNAEMVYSMIKPYVNSDYNLRLKFDYRISLERGFDFQSFANIRSDKYYKLKERFTYVKKFIVDTPSNEFWIKFDTGLADLDDSLHNEKVLFSEDFSIESIDLEKIIAIPEDKRLEFIEKVLKVQLVINTKKLRPEEIIFSTSGLHLKYSVDNIGELMNFKLSFVMPFNKNTRFFFASISEPTYSPKVIFQFESEYFDVKMIPFLSQNVLSKDAMAIDGECEFSIDDEWVLPMSGAVFIITLDEENVECE